MRPNIVDELLTLRVDVASRDALAENMPSVGANAEEIEAACGLAAEMLAAQLLVIEQEKAACSRLLVPDDLSGLDGRAEP